MFKNSSLALFVPWIFTYNPVHTLAPHNLALLANPLD